MGSGNLDNVNQLFAGDLRITVPSLHYTEIYFEYGGKDSATAPGIIVNNEGPEFLWNDVAYLVDRYVTRFTDDERTTFRFEWMQNDFANNDFSNSADQPAPNIWYNHALSTSDFACQNRVLGHAAGGDSGEFFRRLTWGRRSACHPGGDFGYQWRGDVLLNDAATTGRQRKRHYRGGIDMRYFVTDQ